MGRLVSRCRVAESVVLVLLVGVVGCASEAITTTTTTTTTPTTIAATTTTAKAPSRLIGASVPAGAEDLASLGLTEVDLWDAAVKSGAEPVSSYWIYSDVGGVLPAPVHSYANGSFDFGSNEGSAILGFRTAGSDGVQSVRGEILVVLSDGLFWTFVLSPRDDSTPGWMAIPFETVTESSGRHPTRSFSTRSLLWSLLESKPDPIGVAPGRRGGYIWYVAFDADELVYQTFTRQGVESLLDGGFVGTGFAVVGEVTVDDEGYVVEARFDLDEWAEEAARQLEISEPATYRFRFVFERFGRGETILDPCTREGLNIVEVDEGVFACS